MGRGSLPGIALGAALLACLGSSSSALADCAVPSRWLPVTQFPTNETPPPHQAPDCPFYRNAWQYFMYSLQPGADGRPRFLSSYSTIADLFGSGADPQFAAQQEGFLSLAARTTQFPNETVMGPDGRPPKIDAGISQAGPLRGLLIDQNGHPIYYAIHVNDIYNNFLKSNGLTTKTALLNADPDKLEFPEGALELKSAWQVVTPSNSPI